MIEGPSRNFVSIRKLLVDSAFLRVFLAAKKENEICWEKKSSQVSLFQGRKARLGIG